MSDLETSMTDFRCQCCPYGYHLDTDFIKFLDDMYGPDVLRTLKKIERKRHDVRRRLINEQVKQRNGLLFAPSYGLILLDHCNEADKVSNRCN